MSKYTRDVLEPIVKDSRSYAQVLCKLGLSYSGGNHRHIKEKIADNEIDTSHFLGQSWAIGKPFRNRLTPEQILVVREGGIGKTRANIIRRALIESGVVYECVECGLGPEWQGKKMVIEIHHINGKNWDNRKENLMFLCPNCHSQT